MASRWDAGVGWASLWDGWVCLVSGCYNNNVLIGRCLGWAIQIYRPAGTDCYIFVIGGYKDGVPLGRWGRLGRPCGTSGTLGLLGVPV